MINQVTLVGRLTKDPELQFTADDKTVLNFTLALNRFGKAKRHEQDADFIPCVTWGKRAEEMSHYCDKGTLIGVVGELQTRSYLNKEEKRVFVVEVLVRKIRYLSSNRGNLKEKESSMQGNNEDETNETTNDL
ncbi:single-stranded DNA-binding protein [Listeria aquatica]|uniref:Single-stranded DNA-binding protein n=1 Tax=Listeria aquatica TaxID=1494960 RepID=A0A841ZR00_9LIST|nr:single-stranded DNA-binding protein [Listeria aquatica]MBC1521852.1 single-stranded DNA-binding protein [Listeria aquatica]